MSFLGSPEVSAFDVRFFAMQGVGLLFLVLALRVKGRLTRQGKHRMRQMVTLLIVAVGVLLGAALPIYWRASYPTADPVVAVGRVLFGGPPSLINACIASFGTVVGVSRNRRNLFNLLPVFTCALAWLGLTYV